MKIHSMTVGPMAVNTYLVASDIGGEALIIDPAGSEKQILKVVQDQKFKVKAILLTHGHADHIAGVEKIVKTAKFPVWIHAGDAAMLSNPALNLSALMGTTIQLPPADRLLADGDVIWLDNIILTVRHTPGHTKGGICLVGPNVVFTGDTLFCGSIGRTDFSGGDMDALLGGIRRHLMVLDDNYRVFPGHGPQTSIGRERLQNPFLQGPEADGR